MLMSRKFRFLIVLKDVIIGVTFNQFNGLVDEVFTQNKGESLRNKH